MSYNYNEISKLYDDVREADLQTVEFMIQKAQIDNKSRVLEIGCGTGNYLTLIQRLTGADTWGIDSSEGMLGKAREKCMGATLVHGDAIQLSDIPNEAFDLVYMVDVIHHIKDIDKMFQSINRVLKQGAALIIFTDSHEHIKNRLTTKYFPETLKGELARYQDTEEVMQTLLMNGYHNVEHSTLVLADEPDYGAKLIAVAEKKGYSMFGLITEEEITAGIQRIKDDMERQPIVYHQRAPYVMGVK